jgi:hypothetical protein
MLKNLPNRAGMLILAAMAACALAAPSTGSAANWAPVGTAHVLDSSTFSFLMGGALNAGASCTRSQFNSVVQSSANLVFTSGTFLNCTGTAGAINCSVTMAPTTTQFAVGTAIAENNLKITNIRIDASFTNKPGAPTSCALPTTVSLTGDLSGSAFGTSTWDFFAHTMTFNNASGLTAHVGAGIGSFPATVTAAFRDTTQTLTIT